eukprot:3136774-Pleurochrysis_carterae.AAC.3
MSDSYTISEIVDVTRAIRLFFMGVANIARLVESYKPDIDTLYQQTHASIPSYPFAPPPQVDKMATPGEDGASAGDGAQ